MKKKTSVVPDSHRGMMKQQVADDCIDYVRSQTNECLLMLSLGKDSLVVLDMIYPKFDRIVCVFMYFVKGLTHIEKWINWVKAKYPKIEFMQVPHWCLTHILNSGMFCVRRKMKLMQLKDVVSAVQAKTGIKWVFVGMKKADGMNRLLMLKTYEKSHYTQYGYAYPLAEYTQKEILAYMMYHNLPEPVRYSSKASSGVGFNLDFVLWLRENAPQDLDILFKTFPMSERLLYEHDNHS